MPKRFIQILSQFVCLVCVCLFVSSLCTLICSSVFVSSGARLLLSLEIQPRV
jgi:hypothetical protein